MQNPDKKRIAYYAALSILFGSVELFIPKILPFFKLGLSNIPVLIALDMPFGPFMALAVIKALGNSYISGNIFSYFVIVSLAQSIASALIMWVLNKTNLFSRYGLSLSGAFVSSVVQLGLASIYVGGSVMSFLPVMLFISLAASIIVAYFSFRLDSLENPPVLQEAEGKNIDVLTITLLLASSLSSILIKDAAILFAVFVIALFTQKLAGRKIRIVPHITLMIFMVFFSLLTREGRVLFEIGKMKITEGALLSGIAKGLRLSTTIALSQAYSSYLRPGRNILGDTLRYFTMMFSSFKKGEGNIEERILRALSLKDYKDSAINEKKAPHVLFISSSIAIVILMALDKLPLPIV